MDSRFLLYRYLLRLRSQYEKSTLYAYGNQNWSILAIGTHDYIKIQKIDQGSWATIINFILSNKSKYILGYMGYSLHEGYQTNNSCFPACLLFIPESVIEFGKKLKENNSENLNSISCVAKYAQGLLSDEKLFQAIKNIIKWTEGAPRIRRLTIAYKVNLPQNVDMLKTFLYPLNQQYDFMYNIYIRFFDTDNKKIMEYVGFSPELIINGKGDSFNTYKLSGTIPICSVEDPLIYSKVINEHNLSISNLKELLGKLGENINSRPFFVTMNNIIHLCTIFKTKVYENLSIADVFRCMLMKGASPKIPTELLKSVENFDRGPYYGNHILIKPDGTYMASQILRTIFNCNGEYYSIAGASINALSDPFKEVLEIYYKFKDICFYES